MVFGLVTYFIKSFCRWRRRHDPYVIGIGLGCLMAVLSMILHSIVDFPFHNPALALYASVLLALGWRVLHSKETEQ